MNTMTLTPQRLAFSWRDFLSSFLLLELFKGMALTGKDHHPVSRREDPSESAF